jgi:hypothetical protein
VTRLALTGEVPSPWCSSEWAMGPIYYFPRSWWPDIPEFTQKNCLNNWCPSDISWFIILSNPI